MKKKGFTLIELLAVIVILAIIALIATPAVLNVIEDSRKSAAEASARNIVNAAKTYYMSESIKGTTHNTIDLEAGLLKYNGDQASKGFINFNEDGKASGKMYIGGYCVTVGINNVVTSEKVSEDECDVTVDNTNSYTFYANGKALYYDPVANRECHYNESVTGSSTTEGCMKWYAFLDSEENSKVKLMLAHNITKNIDISVLEEDEEFDISKLLKKNLTNWNSEVANTLRFISAEEIHEIAPSLNNSWNKEDENTYYYFHDGSQSVFGQFYGQSLAGKNKHAWLFDNLYYCMQYGCNEHDVYENGYLTDFTAEEMENDAVWVVSYKGGLVVDSGIGGIRPVIEVSKTIFEGEPEEVPYEDGTLVAFNPNTGEACLLAEALKYGNEGCMEWFTFSDTKNSDTVNLILGHNTTLEVPEGETIEATNVNINNQLNTDISGWHESVKSTARIISAEEVNRIAPTDGTHVWDINNGLSLYYFQTGNQYIYTGDIGTNKYAWLFRELGDCYLYGGNGSHPNTKGYWTSSHNSARKWVVAHYGALSYADIEQDEAYGIRPVITVQKSVLAK